MNARSMPNDARGRGRGREEMFNSPSTPPSSTSTRDTATLDGWTIKILLALAGYLDSVGHALSDVPGHLRWLADGTDLVRLLGLEQPSPPVDCSPSQGPVVARSAAEIRADLAVLYGSAGFGVRGRLGDAEAVHRLLGDVPALLSEVEAAHRFEQQWTAESAELATRLNEVAAERDALRAENRDVWDRIDAEIEKRCAAESVADSLRGVVQAVEDAIPAALLTIGTLRHGMGCGMRRAIYEGARCDCDLTGQIRSAVEHVLRSALAATADAPQPPNAKVTPVTPNLSTAAVTHQSWCSLARTSRGPCDCRTSAGPSPAVLPEKEQRP